MISHAWRQIGLRKFPYQLIVPNSPPAGGQAGFLFQLERDPGEQRDRAAVEPDRAASLLVALGRALDEQKASGPVGSASIMDDVLRHRLRALGYSAEEPKEFAAPPE